jgi:hypothetical protein
MTPLSVVFNFYDFAHFSVDTPNLYTPTTTAASQQTNSANANSV